jgi:hypothetical protein
MDDVEKFLVALAIAILPVVIFSAVSGFLNPSPAADLEYIAVCKSACSDAGFPFSGVSYDIGGNGKTACVCGIHVVGYFVNGTLVRV